MAEKHLAHPGQTCMQYTTSLWEDPTALVFIKKTHKRCPGAGCQAWIEKTGECHKMECKKRLGGCGVYFCWDCKAIFPAGVHEHMPGCDKRNGYCGGTVVKVLPKPGNGIYREGWDKDPDFKGTGREYTGGMGYS
jgi:hypothetical protein